MLTGIAIAFGLILVYRDMLQIASEWAPNHLLSQESTFENGVFFQEIATWEKKITEKQWFHLFWA